MSKHLYKRGEVYWGRTSHKGTEHRKSLKTTSREVAKSRYDAWVKLIEGAQFGEKETHTFDQAAVKFMDEHLPTIKPRSADRYVTSIGNLMPTFENVDLDKLGSAHLNDFVTRRRAEVIPPPPRKKKRRKKRGEKAPQAKVISSATIRRDLNCLSSIMGLAIEWEWIDVNPVGPFLKRMKRRGLRESAARTRYLTREEERVLLKNAAPYVADAIKFAIDTGLRKEEQFSRQWAHIDFDRNEVQVEISSSKTARARRVPLMKRTRTVLMGLKRHDDLPFVFWHMDKRRRAKPRRVSRKLRPVRFATMDRGLKAAAERAGIEDLRWHDLRRTCGCRLLQDHDFSIEKVSKWLGHTSIMTTEKAYAFLHVEHLHKAIEHEHAPALERPVIEGVAMEVRPDAD